MTLVKFKHIVDKMFKTNAFDGISVYPSIVKLYEKDIIIKPFWNNKIKKLSDKLYLPTQDKLCQNNNDIVLKFQSWFKIKSYDNPDSKYYRLKTKNINQNVSDITKCRQIKLYLNQDQKKYMFIIINTYRYFYNRCVAYINNFNKEIKESWFYTEKVGEPKIKIIIKDIKNICDDIEAKKNLKSYYPYWLLNGFPSHIISEAIRECISRFNTCLKVFKKNKKPFTLRFKTKKNIYQTINLEENMINKKNHLFTNWKINGIYMFRNIKSSEKFNKYNIRGSTLTYHTVLKTYTLNLTYTVKSKLNNNKKVVAIDTGTRCFATIYSENKVIEFGNNVEDKLYKVCREIDIIKSHIDKKYYYIKNDNGEKTYYFVNSRKRVNLRKALHRKITYAKNLKKDLHDKIINYLCTNYKTVILPPFETSKMVGKLHSKTARLMYNLGFGQFKEKFKEKAKEYNLNLQIHSECYTSKTCTRCGNIKYNLGSKKIYKCNKCKLVLDRDINGARNILLKNMEFI